jgi:hypothetical protein
VKRYIASTEVHVGTSGFTNYGGTTPTSITRTQATIRRDLGPCVLVNGDDDWYAPRRRRPEVLAEDLGLIPLALYQSGISGITSSGIVLSEEQYRTFRDAYVLTYGDEPTVHLTVTRL